jgi:SagB-type dehydrogenase family enzyme
MPQYIKDLLEKTKSQYMSHSPQAQGMVEQPPLELPVAPDAALIPLPAPASLKIPDISMRDAVERRRSVRRYAEEKISIEELSYMLWMTQGIKEVTGRPATLRTVPSAGSRHAFETYLLVNRVEGLDIGLYRFVAGQHALCNLEASDTIRQDLTLACYNQGQITNCAVVFIWAAVSERMTWRYVERGFRYLLLDAGHVCQNLYLAGEACGCGVCAIAAYDDDQINKVLELDGEQQWVIYMGTVGKKPAPRK